MPRLGVRLETLQTAHRGLVLDRYVPVKTEQDKKESRKPLLERVVNLNSGDGIYPLAYRRWESLARSLADPVILESRLRDRLALGLGIESVHEIGCRVHATYGVPVIPGSSLKGVLREFVARSFPDEANFLFGGTDLAGFARVHDAWWVPGTGRGFALDVITVHHQDYYSGKSAPVDTESPIPVQFLAITGKFLFVLEAPNAAWSKFLESALRSLLSTEGLCAKRSAGYGRFLL